MKKEDKNIKEKESKDKIEIEPVTEAILIFHRDQNDKNWISRLNNGKIVILHRSDTTIPQQGIQYHCKIDEKEGYAIAWIEGLSGYPRAIIKSDGTCVVVENPNISGKKTKTYSDIYEALQNYEDLEFFFTIYRKENKEKIEIDKSLLKDINIEIKLKAEGEPTIKANIKRKRMRNLNTKEIIDKIKSDIK